MHPDSIRGPFGPIRLSPRVSSHALPQLDADAPARSTPTARNLRHYLAGNYTRTGTNSTILPTAQRLSIQSGQLRPFTQFTNPSPEPDTGVHRFIYALYVQPARFNTAGFESVGMEAETRNWNVSRLVTAARLLIIRRHVVACCHWLTEPCCLAVTVADAAWARTCNWSNFLHH